MFGNTHYNIGKQIINKININLSESEKDAFLSGMVYADIGRFIFDKQIHIVSDSSIFVEEMKKHALTSTEKWFAYGIEMHIMQDQKTAEFLKHTFEKGGTGYLNYIMECGLLDYYFLRNNQSYIYNEFLDKFNYEQVISGLDVKSITESLGISDDKILPMCKSIISGFYTQVDKCHLMTYDELIIKTYHALGLKTTKEDIHEQEANIVGASVIACSIASKQNFPDELSAKMSKEFEEMVNLCVNTICKSNF